ncbi:MAG: hypothetical protein HYR95_02480 [Candidatus Colwellbacteria bacterium]|nr:hypothetical protein [Candidatus Colwellbacteria bacterium]
MFSQNQWYESTVFAVIVGVVSGLTVFLVDRLLVQVQGGDLELLVIFTSGTIFGIISGAYFVYASKSTPLRKVLQYIVWVSISAVSFFIASIMSVGSVGGGIAGSITPDDFVTGFASAVSWGGLIGIGILMLGFRVFSKPHKKDVLYLLLAAFLIPMILSLFFVTPELSYTMAGVRTQNSVFMFCLYIFWQTAVIVIFSRVLIRENKKVSQIPASE